MISLAAVKEAGFAMDDGAMPRAARKTELVSIQYLRAIAALAVVVYHLEPQLRRMGYAGHWPGGLSGGVDIFFVISGFIMWTTTYGRAMTAPQFYHRRIVRIVPLYWLITTFTVLMMLVAPSSLQSSRFELGHVVKSYLFIPALHPTLNSMEPAVIPGWTLNYEMAFYLLFGLSLYLPPRRRLLANVATLALLVIAGLLMRPEPNTMLGFYTSSIVLEFAAGMAAGWFFLHGKVVSLRLAWPFIVLGSAAILVLTPALPLLPRSITMGIPATMVVLGALSLERLGRIANLPLLHLLGNASYSLYLSHPVALSAVSQFWRKLSLHLLAGGWSGFALVALVVATLAGAATHLLIEQPLVRAFARQPAQ